MHTHIIKHLKKKSSTWISLIVKLCESNKLEALNISVKAVDRFKESNLENVSDGMIPSFKVSN
jgi:hypothetical protein